MTVLKANDENIKRAAETIRNGGLVAFPTETVYGLGADALNPKSVAMIFQAKERPFFDPLIVHVSNSQMAEKLFREKNELAERLMKRFWPGPLTLVLPKSSRIPEIITSGLNTVALRMPNNETALKLIDYSQSPIAAPSANRFSCLSPTEADHVNRQLGEKIDIILDGGACSIGIESTIVKPQNNKIVVLRPGGIPVNLLEEVAPTELAYGNLKDNKQDPESPGQLPFHYSPTKQLIIEESIKEIKPKTGYLFFQEPKNLKTNSHCRILSPKGDTVEAATNLFSFLHQLDAMDIEKIIAQTIPKEGLGIAIMDRLTKASKKYEIHN